MDKKEDKPLSYRERLAIRLVLIATKIAAGRCYDGGLNADVDKLIDRMNEEVLLEPINIKRREYT